MYYTYTHGNSKAPNHLDFMIPLSKAIFAYCRDCNVSKQDERIVYILLNDIQNFKVFKYLDFIPI